MTNKIKERIISYDGIINYREIAKEFNVSWQYICYLTTKLGTEGNDMVIKESIDREVTDLIRNKQGDVSVTSLAKHLNTTTTEAGALLARNELRSWTIEFGLAYLIHREIQVKKLYATTRTEDLARSLEMSPEHVRAMAVRLKVSKPGTKKVYMSKEKVKEMQKSILEAPLDMTASQLAKELGVDRKTIYNHRRLLKIKSEKMKL